MNPVLIDLGFIQIYWYSALILVGILVAYYIIEKEANKFKMPSSFIWNMLFYTIILGLIGARLYYVVLEWPQYSDDLMSIFKVWEGGLAIHGGIIFGLIFVLIYANKYKVNKFRLLDILVVGLIIAQAIGRWGNFFNGEAHGPATTIEALQNLFIPQFIIDGMYIGGTYYQPTFLYESLWCLVGFGLLLFLRRRYYWKVGQTFSFYLIWYGIGRYFIESLRTDSLMLFDLKIAQIVSLIMIITGLILFIIKGSGSKLRNRYNDLENVEEVKF